MTTSPFVVDGIAVIIGLGNPGPKFSMTRHNIGFLFLDHLAKSFHASWRTVGNADVASIRLHDKEILLVKPQTFMNSSGDVWPMLAKKGIKSSQVLVVHDELEKKFGTHQIRLGGSARGHNGLRSLITRCGEEFWRLRLGIDRPADKNTVPDYVLNRFPKAEEEQLTAFFERVALQEKLI